MFFLVSALGGLLVAGLMVPTAGVAAEVAKSSAQLVEQIPAEFETPPQAVGSKVLMADGSELTSFYDDNRVYVPLAEIAPIMRQAQVAVEDQRFFEHGALDLKGTLRALVRTSSGNTQGGSTLTQQYVKLVLLDKAVKDDDKEGIDAANNRTFSRKVLELRYAIALEQKLSKDEILERYLNLAYYGDRSYGVEAAAHHYFNTTAKELTLSQAAMLAGLVRNPATTDPVRHEKLAIERRNNVLDVMAQQKVATASDVAAAKKEPFDRAKVQQVKHGCIGSIYPHLCSIVEKTLTNMMPSLGPDEDTRRNLLNRGGLTIQTEIDPRTQDAAQAAVSNFIYPTDPVIATMTIMEPGTGLIKAAAQSRPEIGDAPGQSWYNYTMDSIRGGAEGYFGGSTFKAFTIAAALEKGLPASTSFESPKSLEFAGDMFRTCDGMTPAWGKKRGVPWVVNTGSAGYYDMYAAAKASSNTYFVQLEQATGLCEVANMAKKLGLQLATAGKDIVDANYQNPSLTLGTAEITPISLANAYATLAARGMRCDPIILKSAVSAEGKEYAVPSANCTQVIPQKVADAVNDILREPFKSGGTADDAFIPGYNIAGKTGTDTNAPTIWTVGYTPQLAGAAMITVDKQSARYKPIPNGNRSLEGAPVRNGKARLRGSSGGEAGAGIWKPAMAVALKGLEKGNFTPPSSDMLQGAMADIPSCSGKSLQECQNVIAAAGFSTRTVSVASNRPKGTFLGISPTGRAAQGSTVRLQVSEGPVTVEPTGEPLAPGDQPPTPAGPGAPQITLPIKPR